MIAPDQFLRAFLRERDVAYAGVNARLSLVHAKYFGEPLSSHASDFLLHERADVDFEVVQHLADSATVVTRHRIRNVNLRERYHLAAVGDEWKITRIDRECFCCLWGDRAMREACPKCQGEGWYDPRAAAPKPATGSERKPVD